MRFQFDDQMLDHVQVVHDNSGPRAAFAFYIGRADYMTNTADLDTRQVEDFAISFYTEYNARACHRY